MMVLEMTRRSQIDEWQQRRQLQERTSVHVSNRDQACPSVSRDVDASQPLALPRVRVDGSFTERNEPRTSAIQTRVTHGSKSSAARMTLRVPVRGSWCQSQRAEID